MTAFCAPSQADQREEGTYKPVQIPRASVSIKSPAEIITNRYFGAICRIWGTHLTRARIQTTFVEALNTGDELVSLNVGTLLKSRQQSLLRGRTSRIASPVVIGNGR